MKNKLFTITLSCCMILLVIAQSSYSQQTKTMTFNAEDGEITVLMGLGAIIRGGDKGLVIEMIPPQDQREKTYKDVDLANQDKIIMCNGKKVKTIVDLNEAIEKVEIGAEISLGIKRGKEMMIVSFPKADPKASGKMMMMTTTMDDDGTHNETTMMKEGVVMTGVVMMDAGMILQDTDGKPSIVAVLPDLIEIIEGEAPKEGDVIVAINDIKDLSSDEINNKYDKINIGDTVSFTFLRDTKEYKMSFKKQKPSGNEVIIRK